MPIVINKICLLVVTKKWSSFVLIKPDEKFCFYNRIFGINFWRPDHEIKMKKHIRNVRSNLDEDRAQSKIQDMQARMQFESLNESKN